MISICVVLIIFASLLLFQANHYAFVKSQQQHKHVNLIGEQLEAKLKEFDEYKKKVDALVLKNGFKL